MQEEAISLGHQEAGLVDYVELLDTRRDNARRYEINRATNRLFHKAGQDRCGGAERR